MKVQATKSGFYAGRRIREGEVFAIPEGAKPGKWMAAVKDGTPMVAAKAEDDAPRTLSEIARKDAAANKKASKAPGK